MVIKVITVRVKPGHREGYLAAQSVWNRESRVAPGYLGCFCGADQLDDMAFRVIAFWRSRPDLDAWMASEHDRIAELAGGDEHCDSVEVKILDPALPGESLPPGLLKENTLEASDVQFWSEAYKGTAALRTALRLDLFEHLTGTPRTVRQVASASELSDDSMTHLLRALESMGFVEQEDGGWINSGVATRTLVKGADAYQGDAVLHNSQPGYVRRAFGFGDLVGLPPDDEGGAEERHARFLRAMANTAAGGQAQALVDALDLTGCRKMLDVGGATGPYSIALCRAYPELHSEILDLEETVPLAEAAIAQAGLGDRVGIRAHDYRRGRFPGDVDVVLLSNVLRGETVEAVGDILTRARPALATDGRIVVVDHFPEDPPEDPGLRASLFGIHLVDKSNFTMSEMTEAITQAGFSVVRADACDGRS